MLTKKEIELIKKSWAIVRMINPSIIGDVFYSKLFYDNPELRKMFPKNMEGQYKKIIDMFSIIVARIENFDGLKGDIIDMAKRHEGYGVKPHHYNLVGKALLWTLQKGLGNEWNDEVRSAWINCYAVLSGTMISASGK
ncbi:MAG TPA: globin domain-containing protein [Chitinophagaceae bacterium]